MKVEQDDPIYGQRFKEVYDALKKKLSAIPFEANKKHIDQSQSNFMPLSGVLDSVSKISTTNKKLNSVHRTMWNVLESQDHFISRVVDCQLESRETRGRKDAKEKHLRESLQKACQTAGNGGAIPLPSAPLIWVTGVKADSARMFKSALYPALIEFYVDQNFSSKSSKPDRSKPNTYRVMVCNVLFLISL